LKVSVILFSGLWIGSIWGNGVNRKLHGAPTSTAVDKPANRIEVQWIDQYHSKQVGTPR